MSVVSHDLRMWIVESDVQSNIEFMDIDIINSNTKNFGKIFVLKYGINTKNILRKYGYLDRIVCVILYRGIGSH